MGSRGKIVAAGFACLLLAFGAAPVGRAQSQAGGQAAAKPIGTIKSITGTTLTLASDAGPLLAVPVGSGVKILRIEPGAKDLKNAETLEFEDLQAGDRVLVLGTVSSDGHSVTPSSIVAMKKADVASKRERERQDWQRRGVGGLVTAVDAPGDSITISTQSLAGSKNLTVRVSKDTVLRRYAPDSVKFDDAKIGTLDQVKPGDQLRARGSHSADGDELAAEEIVSGTFQNIPGTIVSVDAAANSLTVADLITKKNVSLKITPDSQLRKLPPLLAQMMAMRLKSAAGANGPGNGAAAGPNGGGAGKANAAGGPDAAGGAGAGAGGAETAGRGRNGGGDLQQMLARVPAATLGDMQKGDAVMIVSTEGTGSAGGMVITLLAGIEPLLAASPNGAGQSMILPPWSLEAPGGDAAQ